MADPVVCPSARCEPGALLIGVVLPGGRVAFASDRIVIDDEFVQTARLGRSPERRFRFGAPCMRGACRQWTGSRCSVIDEAMEAAGAREAALPACAIRPACRWYRQAGGAACAVCPEIVADTGPAAGSSQPSA